MRFRRSRLSSLLTQRLLEHFVAGTPARTAAELIGVNRNTARTFYHRLRIIIADRSESSSPVAGEIEVDESYFGGPRKGKRGRGAAGKLRVFGILKRGGKVYTKIIPNARKMTLLPIIHQMITPNSIVYTDSLPRYNTLDISDFHHFRTNHSERFVQATNHINGIENFWNQAKRHLRKYNGSPHSHSPLFLKECEWRFNYGPPKQLLTTLKYWVKPYLR